MVQLRAFFSLDLRGSFCAHVKRASVQIGFNKFLSYFSYFNFQTILTLDLHFRGHIFVFLKKNFEIVFDHIRLCTFYKTMSKNCEFAKKV